MSTPATNKQIVLEAFETLFNKRDYAKAARFWSPRYIQHSAHIEPGREGLFNLVKSLPSTLRYENAVVAVDGDFVLLHGRFSGSGLPMFGTSFASREEQAGPSDAQSGLSPEEARAMVAPLYDALNRPAQKDVAALLARACNPDYKSYSTNEDWLNRDQLAEVFKAIGAAVPDLRWTIQDVLTVRDQIIVRGEASGTPTGDLWGTKPTGKSFKTLSIDVFSVQGGKLASAYHVENWVGALQQIGK